MKIGMSMVRGTTLVLLVSALFGCGGGGGGSGGGNGPPRTIPNLDGVWAGSWTGYDPGVGTVTGTWVADIAQSNTSLTGSASLRGDIDCMDGILAGSANANNAVEGSVDRPPCQLNQWSLTAINMLDYSASGSWTQTASGAYGSLSGVRIATHGGGPRIRFVNPPGGLTGTLVTVVGTNFGVTTPDNSLSFTGITAGLMDSDATTITTSVPGASATGLLSLTTPLGTARSPLAFNRNVKSPLPLVAASPPAGAGAESIAMSPDGRKAYVANRTAGSVSLINAVNNSQLASPSMGGPVQAIVAHPDGRWVYAIGGANGIYVLDAGTATKVDTIALVEAGNPISVGSGASPIPNGLAVSPDGRLLFAVDNRDGGKVVVVDIATRLVVASTSLGAGMMPLAAVVHPAGKVAYFAFADTTGSGRDTIKIFDIATLSGLSGGIAVGRRPQGLAVTPDGTKIFASINLDNSVSAINANTNLVTATTPVGLSPVGLAVSPDGARIYVANSGASTVSILYVSSNAMDTSLSVGATPLGVVISPDGSRGYVTNSASATLSELGGPRTLTISKAGTGIGTVTDDQGELNCGTNCEARYTYNTVVTLTATPATGSTFSGWSGDAGCSSGVISMTVNKNCTATFTADIVQGSAGGPQVVRPAGSGGDCFIATAAFGSGMAEEVMTLRKFRDEHLLTNAPGRGFVDFYYRHSPPVANYLRGHDLTRTGVRWALYPLVFAVKHPASAMTLVLLTLLLPFGVRRYRVGRRSARPSF